MMMQKIKRVIATKLTEREQNVVKLRYGIDCARAFTQKEVAEQLGISRSYISRIENKTLAAIREELSPEESRQKEL